MGGRAAPWVRAQVLLLGLIAVLPVVLSLPFLGEAMDEDEGVYFSVAMFDRLPYGGVFDHKPPVVYGWYHLALLLHGGEASVATVRLLAAMNIGVAALGVVWLGSRYRDRTFGLVAGMAFSLATANQYTQPGANTEVFLLAPCVFGAACFLRGAQERRLWPMLAAGVLGGFGTAQQGLTGGGQTSEALAILLGGGTSEGQHGEGYNKLLAIRRRQINEYMHRLEVVGLGDRRQRMNPMMQAFLDPPKN
jgi:hypothetical protein